MQQSIANIRAIIFDIKMIYENEGLTDPLFRTFLVYVASSGRPPHELLQPNRADVAHVFNQEFDGMTIEKVSVDELLDIRELFLIDIQARLDQKAKRFCCLFTMANPTSTSSACRRRLPYRRSLTCKKLRNDNLSRHAEQRGEIERLFTR